MWVLGMKPWLGAPYIIYWISGTPTWGSPSSKYGLTYCVETLSVDELGTTVVSSKPPKCPISTYQRHEHHMSTGRSAYTVLSTDSHLLELCAHSPWCNAGTKTKTTQDQESWNFNVMPRAWEHSSIESKPRASDIVDVVSFETNGPLFGSRINATMFDKSWNNNSFPRHIIRPPVEQGLLVKNVSLISDSTGQESHDVRSKYIPKLGRDF